MAAPARLGHNFYGDQIIIVEPKPFNRRPFTQIAVAFGKQRSADLRRADRPFAGLSAGTETIAVRNEKPFITLWMAVLRTELAGGWCTLFDLEPAREGEVRPTLGDVRDTWKSTERPTKILKWASISVLSAIAVLMPGPRAQAEDLVMPYACSVESGQIQLMPSPPTSYRVVGKHEEAAFAACPNPVQGANCPSMTIHRFDMICGGVKVPWAQVAASARTLGVELPPDMPKGFALVGALNARFLFPALARFSPFRSSVEREALSVDSVADSTQVPVLVSSERPAPTPAPELQNVIAADMGNEEPNAALRFMGVAGALLIMVFAVGFLAAWRNTAHVWAEKAEKASTALPQRMKGWWENVRRQSFSTWSNLFGRRVKSNTGVSNRDRTALMNALAMVIARLAEAELEVGSLPNTFVVREVLQAELNQLRGRLDEIERRLDVQPKQKSAAMMRAIQRELDRILRIAQGAAHDTTAAGREPWMQSGAGQDGSSAPMRARNAQRMPQSVQEAYHLLGINEGAAPGVAKKLVDALRMSWHPDFARDDADRHVREVRIKQINVAWDLIKNRQDAAA